MNIFVGNLPFTTSESDLRSLFTPYGEIQSVAVITDRDTGRSRGFGFVELADDAKAREAIEELDGYRLESRNISVSEAKPRSR
jgi:RNA recognition motif-containing protein